MEACPDSYGVHFAANVLVWLMRMSQAGRTVRGDNQREVSMLTELDYRISIENSISALCKADKAAEVAHVLMVFGHGARSVEDLAPSDYEAVFSELHDHEREMDD